MKSFAIVGYSLNADTYCPDDIRDMFATDADLATDSVETVLARAGQDRGIDIHDLRSFDSGDFPKPIFASQVEDSSQRCAQCGETFIGD